MCVPKDDATSGTRGFTTLLPSHTCTIAHAFIFHNVLVLEGFEDLDFSLKVTDVFSGAVLQFLYRHHLTGVVLQGIIPAHFHTAKISLETGDNYCV